MSLIAEINSDLIDGFNDLDDLVKAYTISYNDPGLYDPAAGISSSTEISGPWRGIQIEYLEKDLTDEFVGKTVISILSLSYDRPFPIDNNINYSILFNGKNYIAKKIKQDPAFLTYQFVCIEL